MSVKYESREMKHLILQHMQFARLWGHWKAERVDLESSKDKPPRSPLQSALFSQIWRRLSMCRDSRAVIDIVASRTGQRQNRMVGKFLKREGETL